MATVTGQLDGKPIELDNAATEATLRLLLQSSISANNQSIVNIRNLAQKSGLDPAAVAAANQNLIKTSSSSSILGTSFYALGSMVGTLSPTIKRVNDSVETLVSGSAKVSDVFTAMKDLPFGLGFVATQFNRLAIFQEAALISYQTMTSAGVNFGGSLTTLKMSATQTYMTLGTFTNLIKTNSENFAKMGGTANDGAMAFVKLSKELNSSSGAGATLRALGYTSEQVNQGLIDYISISGGRTKNEMANTSKLTASSAEYMMQLDSLAQITGKTKESQVQALKEASANSAYEAYLLTLDEAGRKKAMLSMQNALAAGGQAAGDLLKSELLGLPPMTDAAQKLQAIAPNVANGIKQMSAAVGNVKATTDSVNKGFDAMREGATIDSAKYGKTLQALSFGTDSTSKAMQSLQQQANLNTTQDIKNASDSEAQRNSIASLQKVREESQAANASKAQMALTQLGQEILAKLLPSIDLLMPEMNGIVTKLTDAALWLLNNTAYLKALGIAVVGFTAIMTMAKMKMAADALSGKSGWGTRGTATNPLHVTSGSGGLGASAGSKMGWKGKAGLAAGGIVGGLALDYAGDKLKESGHEKLSAGADIAGTALTGASMGMLLGPIGAAVGGALGAAYGTYQNKEALFSKAEPTPLEPAPAEKPANQTEVETAVTQTSTVVKNEIETLTKLTSEMLRVLKETSSNILKNVDATKALNGNLYSR